DDRTIGRSVLGCRIGENAWIRMAVPREAGVTAGLVFDVLVRHGSDNHVLVRQAGHTRQMLANHRSRNARGDGRKLSPYSLRRIRLEIKSLKLGWAAEVEDEDARFCAPKAARDWTGQCLTLAASGP